MEWSSTAISWDMQVMLMLIVLSPVFILCGLLTLVAPVLLADAEKHKVRYDKALPTHAAVEIGPR